MFPHYAGAGFIKLCEYGFMRILKNVHEKNEMKILLWYKICFKSMHIFHNTQFPWLLWSSIKYKDALKISYIIRIISALGKNIIEVRGKAQEGLVWSFYILKMNKLWRHCSNSNLEHGLPRTTLPTEGSFLCWVFQGCLKRLQGEGSLHWLSPSLFPKVAGIKWKLTVQIWGSISTIRYCFYNVLTQ